jgi:hypothetical protein
MNLVLDKRELSKNVNITNHHKIDVESNLTKEETERVEKLISKHKCTNIIRAKKALDSCKQYNQKFVAARYGILAVEHDFEKFKPTKKSELSFWEMDKHQAKLQFYLFIEEGGFDV